MGRAARRAGRGAAGDWPRVCPHIGVISTGTQSDGWWSTGGRPVTNLSDPFHQIITSFPKGEKWKFKSLNYDFALRELRLVDVSDFFSFISLFYVFLWRNREARQTQSYY